ncbi:hypothetical protein CPLU01_02279 [Colletotrichum plurivorum]|uniref:Cyclin-dependent kinase n=1 Tax=Colletotrichum plurivorum TaxID=2175906 RepID=A0A8H6KWX0_9PEZI|nr:hypothetical protein CPLU01_02279 [Colletotrichum plurivorum]
MDPSSPTKRRALAPLDANVNAMSPGPKLHNKSAMLGSPRKSPMKSPSGLKRSLDVAIFDENSVVAKKQCQEPVTTAPPAAASAPAPTPAPAQTRRESIAKEVRHSQYFLMRTNASFLEKDMKLTFAWSRQTPNDLPQQPKTDEQPESEVRDDDQQEKTPRNRSASPDTSSVFDNSAMDTSQNTTMLTEPDLEQARTLPPPRPRRVLTREEQRQRVRILRLKLGLANYKLQTGQEDVPLDRLEMKPLPGREGQTRALPRVTVQPPSSRDGPPEEPSVAEAGDQEQEQLPADKAATPSAPEAESETESTIEDDTTTAACGGVASSLLSLARASSSVSTSS